MSLKSKYKRLYKSHEEMIMQIKEIDVLDNIAVGAIRVMGENSRVNKENQELIRENERLIEQNKRLVSMNEELLQDKQKKTENKCSLFKRFLRG